MKSYKRYLDVIVNFQMHAVDSFQDILVCDNFRFGIMQDLDSFKRFVLKELADAVPGNVKLKLKKIEGKKIGL